ncbi:hypothetical protein GCM10010961_37460 [Pseudodonghicola xiamenensis]|uniref:Uncharacterized protein n=1 Tax=Pseudodonghicola xiamenensis TaxID=337702 RepID=A0A8J3HC90_9RHOB|nr:hypothetical protein GCM10010961_37460 [Pseudodonghicola xiamenensis]
MSGAPLRSLHRLEAGRVALILGLGGGPIAQCLGVAGSSIAPWWRSGPGLPSGAFATRHLRIRPYTSCSMAKAERFVPTLQWDLCNARCPKP